MMFQGRGAIGTKRRRGTAMIEMALTLPVLLLVLFGSLEFGLLFSRYQLLLGVTASAAREASVFRQNCSPPTVELEVMAVIESVNLIGMDLADKTLTEVIIDGLCLPGRFVTVEVIYHMPFELVGGLMALNKETAIAEIPIRAQVRMRNDR